MNNQREKKRDFTMAEVEEHPEEEKSEVDEEDEDFIRLFSHQDQFFLEEPYIYLINPDLFPEKVKYVKEFKLKEILPDFYSKLLKQGLDFRILGQGWLRCFFDGIKEPDTGRSGTSGHCFWFARSRWWRICGG